MKKILVLAITLTMATIVSFAQDIIVTRDSKRIEAKILEVSSSEVKYKEASNADGPTFVLNTSEINTIIYSNGSVKVFDQQAQPQQQYNNKHAYFSNNNSYNDIQFTGLPITKDGDTYIMGNQRMNEDQYFEYIKQNCQQAWNSYQTGCKLWNNGWTFFGLGTGFLLSGSIFYGMQAGTAFSITGAVFMTVGSAFEVASVPCLIVGGIKKYNSHNVYNEECARQTTKVEFGIQTSQNGLGLAMKF
jgi:hypothetical protein